MNQTENQDVLDIEGEMVVLKEQLLSLAGIVEAVFAESIIALIDNNYEAAHEAQIDDYKAHQVWLRADSIAVDLLSNGNLALDDVQLVCAMSHIALNLKRSADKGTKIARFMNACPASELPQGRCCDILQQMTNIAQNMFSSSIEAFVDQDHTEAGDLHPLYKEVHHLAGELHEEINRELKDPKPAMPAEAGTALIVIGGCIEDIAEFAVDNGHCVERLLHDSNHNNSNDMDGEME